MQCKKEALIPEKPRNAKRLKMEKNRLFSKGLVETETNSSSSSKPHCQGCGAAVKDHPGPHGPNRCMIKIIDALKDRVSVLKKEGERHVELHHQEQMSLKRHEALLATIELLEERVDTLTAQLADVSCLRTNKSNSEPAANKSSAGSNSERAANNPRRN